MPTPTNYTYSIPLDCPGAAINPGKLQLAIAASSIVTALDHISATGGTATNGQVVGSGSLLTIYFKDVLSTADRTTLDGNNGSGGVNTGVASGTHPAQGLIASADNTQSPIVSGEAGVAALGAFAGMVPTSSGRSFGYIALTNNSWTAIRATVYTPQTNAVQRSVGSNNAADTAAGTGAQKVKITYFDAGMNGPKYETVTLNGTTAVNTTATDIAFIERMDVTQAGSGGGNAGTISLFIGLAGGGGVYASIAPGDNQTYWAHHYVPTGKTAYISLLAATVTTSQAQINMQAVNPIAGNTTPQLNPTETVRVGTTTSAIPYAVPVPIVGPCLVWLQAKSDAVGGSGTNFAGFHWTQF